MSKKIVLIADTCIDRFTYGDATRKNPEYPSLVFKPERVEENGGMGLNVYNNLVSLGIDKSNIKTFFPKQKTIKNRYVDQDSNAILLRVDTDDEISEPFDEPELFQLNSFLAANPDSLVCISDYNKNYLGEYYLEKILNLCKSYNIKSFVDSKKKLNSWSKNATYVKINKSEYEFNCKDGWKPENYCENLIVTKGKRGCEWVNKELTFLAEEVEIRDSVGAGDSFLSGLVVGAYEGMNLEESLRFANSVAGAAVARQGVVAVKREWLTNN